jgi:hypothetical protein
VGWAVVLAVSLGGLSRARGDEGARWRLGGVAGGSATTFVGRDADAGEHGTGYGFLLGGTAARAALPWLSVQVEPAFVRRRVDLGEESLTIHRFDLPVELRVEAPFRPLTGFLLAGAGAGLFSSAHLPESEEYGPHPVDIAWLDVFAELGAGVAFTAAGTTWSATVCYRRSLRSIDPDEPGLDIRTGTWLVTAGGAWELR